MKVKEERERAGLKLNFQKMKIMPSILITSWQIDGETVTDFISWAPKSQWTVSAAMKLKESWSWKKSYDKPRECIKKHRNCFADKGLYSRTMAFPVVRYGCESLTIKKAEHQRIEAFVLCCWTRLLVVPWSARRSNWSVLKEINPEYSLEGLMLKLKLQYFGQLM